MHLHFVQSLEPLQGAGLGQAALSLHLAMRRETKSSKDEKTKRLLPSALNSELHAPLSMLLATRDAKFTREWPDVIQGVRKGHPKMFYAPELKRLAAEAVEQAQWFHGHGLYVWTNMWLGGEARKCGKLRKFGLRSAHWATKSGIQGIDCMNGDPDNDAQAMAISRINTPSKDASLMTCILNSESRVESSG